MYCTYLFQVKAGHVAIGDIIVQNTWQSAASSITFWVGNKDKGVHAGNTKYNFWTKKAVLTEHGVQVSVPSNRIRVVKRV